MELLTNPRWASNVKKLLVGHLRDEEPRRSKEENDAFFEYTPSMRYEEENFLQGIHPILLLVRLAFDYFYSIVYNVF